jgi:8-oxo-dGTP pyrophosphatase MutT (NUDIX family)
LHCLCIASDEETSNVTDQYGNQTLQSDRPSLDKFVPLSHEDLKEKWSVTAPMNTRTIEMIGDGQRVTGLTYKDWQSGAVHTDCSRLSARRGEQGEYNGRAVTVQSIPMSRVSPPTRLSSGVVVVSVVDHKLKFLLLRAYRNWDFPKGLVEAGETPIEAALREVREETTLDDISFDWGAVHMETGPYNKGKIARYYIARSKATEVRLPVNPELGTAEHHEARWVDYDKALEMVSPRLGPVVRWAYGIINHRAMPAAPAPSAGQL